MINTKAVRKYLSGHAEPEAALAGALGIGAAHILVIPSFAEGAEVLTTLASIPERTMGDVVTVLVVNEPEGAESRDIESNRQTMHAVRESFPFFRSQHNLHWHKHPRGSLLIVDRTAERAVKKSHGVGLARKAGFDVALALATTQPNDIAILHGTDADVLLPADYFSVAPSSECAAMLHPFRHGVVSSASASSHENVDRALAYEATLRYYVLGLRHARSPHAFHTIGSTISVSPHAYAAVRGVPKRAAAEDFYLLQKLRTIGAIEHAHTGPILLSPRASHRVPFGTGPAIAAAASLSDPWALPTYDPRAFDALAEQGELDALRTLRFVRKRTEEFGDCTLRDAIARAPFIPFDNADTLASLCERLAQLERIEGTEMGC